MKQLISVVTSVYNDEDGITRTIESVLAQTFPDFEYIIVDDGSSDNTFDTLVWYANRNGRVRLLKNNNNLGLTASLNKCLTVANAPYIARIDSGDVVTKDRFEKQVRFLENNGECGVVGSNDIAIFSDFGRYRVINRPLGDASITRCLMYRNCFSHSTLMIRGDVFKDIGLYETRYAQDYDLIVRARQKYKLANLPDFLCARVQSAGSITAEKWRQQELAVFASKLRHIGKLNLVPMTKSLALLNIPLNVMRLCIPVGLRNFYNGHFGDPLPTGFDYNNLSDFYRLLDRVGMK